MEASFDDGRAAEEEAAKATREAPLPAPRGEPERQATDETAPAGRPAERSKRGAPAQPQPAPPPLRRSASPTRPSPSSSRSSSPSPSAAPPRAAPRARRSREGDRRRQSLSARQRRRHQQRESALQQLKAHRQREVAIAARELQAELWRSLPTRFERARLFGAGEEDPDPTASPLLDSLLHRRVKPDPGPPLFGAGAFPRGARSERAARTSRAPPAPARARSMPDPGPPAGPPSPPAPGPRPGARLQPSLYDSVLTPSTALGEAFRRRGSFCSDLGAEEALGALPELLLYTDRSGEEAPASPKADGAEAAKAGGDARGMVDHFLVVGAPVEALEAFCAGGGGARAAWGGGGAPRGGGPPPPARVGRAGHPLPLPAAGGAERGGGGGLLLPRGRGAPRALRV